jgi:hypothetical protein
LKPVSLEVGSRARPIPPNGEIAITVLAPNEQDLVFVKIETNRTRLYPYQPFTVTLVVQVKGLPEKIDANSTTNPLSILRDAPRLMIPWANKDSSLPKGMIPQQELNDWLSSFLVRKPQRGFAVNDFSSNGFGFDDDSFSFGGMFRQTSLQFSSNPKKITRPDSAGKETAYWEFRFSRTFNPQEIGTFSFGPVTLKGTFAAADSNSPQGATAMEVYALASEIQVEVIDVPSENRPKDYIGAFGTFQWSVDLQPRQAKVGDPMTLTLRLSGQGSTTHVKAPDLSQRKEIADHFKTYPPTEEVNEQSCTFTYTIRPAHEGTIIFPSLSAAFFDVKKEEFTTLHSEPISLEITEAKTLQTAPAFRQTPVFPGNLERSEKGLFANMTDSHGAVNPSVNYARWLVTIIILPVIYSIIALSVFVLRLRQSNPKHRRRRGAANRAKQRLSEISTAPHNSLSVPEFVNGLQGVFFGYVTDLTDGVEQGMTTKDACRKLLELGVTEMTVAKVRGLLETLDAARYGGLNLQTLDQLTQQANVLLSELFAVRK